MERESGLCATVDVIFDKDVNIVGVIFETFDKDVNIDQNQNLVLRYFIKCW